MWKIIWNYLKYILPIGSAALLLWLFILSKSAAPIFNYAMEHQDMLRGRITVEDIWADMSGYVEFMNLNWTDPNGETILSVPEGSLRVRPWDILTKNISSTTLQELTLKNAIVSVRFDEDMNVDFIRYTPKPHAAKKEEEPKERFAEKSEEERRLLGERKRQLDQQRMESQWQNFNREGHRLKCRVTLENCPIEIFYLDRHYYLSGVYFDANIDSEKSLLLKAYTGRFGGTMVGSGLTIHGNVDLTCEPVPECSFAVLLQDVKPSSLGFGLNIQDTLTLNTYFTGPISHPVGNGTLYMERLRIPGLEFTDVRGDISYEDAELKFPNVTAKIFDGTLTADGDYNIDTRYYHIHGIGKNLQAAQALKGSGLSCPVDFEMHLISNENSRNSRFYGSFTSGPGRYKWIPFDRLSGRFTNTYRDLRFYDAKIDIGHYQIRTDFFSIIDGKLTLHPIDLVDTDTGNVRMTYERGR